MVRLAVALVGWCGALFLFPFGMGCRRFTVRRRKVSGGESIGHTEHITALGADDGEAVIFYVAVQGVGAVGVGKLGAVTLHITALGCKLLLGLAIR